MKVIGPFRFVGGERVLGAESESGQEREMRYYVDDDAVSKLLAANLSPALADLIEVAAALHIADRLAVRPGRVSDTWKRQIRVDIPVRCLADWKRPEVLKKLFDLLSFMTGEHWDVNFSARPTRLRSSECQQHLFTAKQAEAIRVSLFSGGLDAFAGTVAHMEQAPSEHLVCVSGTPNNRQRNHQKALVKRLRDISSLSVTHISVPCWLESGAEIVQEPTRRTRGILFLALGAVSAVSAGVNRLYLYENGPGAINLPYERIPVGIPNSRSVHPTALILMAGLVETITGQPFQIENRAVFETKAEMCRHPALQRLALAVGETFSCDGFPVQRCRAPQCGVCTSCILRRLALYNAGLANADRVGYGCDLYRTDQHLSSRRLKGLAAMGWQAVRLSEALKEGWAGLMGEFPELRQACMALSVSTKETVGTVQQRLVRLYENHIREWREFPPTAMLDAQRKAA